MEVDMNFSKRVEEFLKLQEQGISLDEAATRLNVKPQTLRKDLNKSGYKSLKGKYIKLEDKKNEVSEQLSFDTNYIKPIEKKVDKTPVAKKTTSKKNKVLHPKKDRKINITQEDLDKLCEVYDWYLEVRDMKALKKKKPKKEIQIDFEATEYKNVNLKVDKNVWEDFLRLCSNSGHDRKELVTQALNDFMKSYKDLL